MEQSTALVIGGGGARGPYALGVTKYLKDRGVASPNYRFDMVVGNSCGALVGAIYYGDLFDTATEVYLNARRKDIMRMTPLRLLMGKGLASQKPLRSLIHNHIPEEAISGGQGAFLVVCTDVRTGELKVFDSRRHSGQMQTALYISASAPVMVPPIPYGKSHLADGGYRTILPIWTALNLGANRVLAVSVTPSRVRLLSRPPQGPFSLLGRWIEFLTIQIEKDEVAAGRLRLDGTQVALKQSSLKLILPQNIELPDPPDFNPQKARELYAAGMRDAANAFDAHESPWDAEAYDFTDPFHLCSDTPPPLA
ncbi:MAG: patatin-like phospholipase family protein [Phycisphaerae bacterium]|nr:patatin-like phospholipase family protein [Phycisphaerae bacterium]